MRNNTPSVFFFVFCLILTACTPKPTSTASPAPTIQILPTNTPLSVDAPAKVLTSESYTLPGGLVTALAIDPATPSTIYAVASGSSLFKSVDGGGHWSLLNAGLPVEDINALQVDPLTPTNLYAITENGNLYQSKDGGQSWTKNSLKDSAAKLKLSPTKAGTIYTSPGYTSYYNISEDGGESWQQINLGLPKNEFVMDIVVDPSKPGTRYAAIKDYNNDLQGKLYKSTDDGKHWRPLDKAIPPHGFIYDLVMDPRMPGTLYVTVEIREPGSIALGTGSGALYKSTNGGESWVNMSLPVNRLIRALIINPLMPASTLYAIMDRTENIAEPQPGLYQSKDKGQTWSELKIPGTFLFQQNVLAIDPAHPGTFYLAADNGVFKSTDNGQNWQKANEGLKAAQVNKLAIDPSTPSTIYSIYDGGVFKSIDSAKTWRDMHLNLNVTGLILDPTAPTTLYAATQDKGMFKSLNGGESWKQINQGLTNPHIRGEDGEHGIFIIDPKNPSTLYVGAYAASYNYIDIEGGLFKSTNAGESWSPISGSVNRPNLMMIDPTNPNIFYVQGYENLFKSTDAGANWSETPFTATTLSMDAKNIYAGTDSGGVLKSSDGGQTWQSANQGLPTEQVTIQDGTGSETLKTIYLPIAVLTLDPAHPNTIYAGIGGWQRGGGVYRSTDGGKTWHELVEAGLPANTRVTDLQFDPLNPNHLYISTYGKDIWSILFAP